jgi:AAA15 family ATPase/GTPase
MPKSNNEQLSVFVDQIHIKGYKSIEDLTVKFQNGLNILIGKNGAGKSNFLEILNEVVTFDRNPFKIISLSSAKITYLTSDKHSIVLELEKDLNKRVEHFREDNYQEFIEKLIINGDVILDTSTEDGEKTFIFNNVKRIYKGNLLVTLISLGYRNIYPFFIKYNLPNKILFIESPSQILANNFNNKVNWSYDRSLKFITNIFWDLEDKLVQTSDLEKDLNKSFLLENLKIQQELIENLRLYTPIEDIRFSENINLYVEDRPFPNEKLITIDNIVLQFKVNGSWLPWSRLSDGSRRLFYIIAEVTYSNGLILIEEPELVIHPHQFNLLMNFLKEQAENKQIIISTHAPKALDHLGLNELDKILLTYYDEKKGTQIRHLTKKEVTKATSYFKEVGFISDYWLLSDLEG